jgi:hypothetical protein
MSSTSDGRGRGTGTFIDLYSLLRFGLRPFDGPLTVEVSVESRPDFLPSSAASLLFLAESDVRI